MVAAAAAAVVVLMVVCGDDENEDGIHGGGAGDGDGSVDGVCSCMSNRHLSILLFVTRSL